MALDGNSSVGAVSPPQHPMSRFAEDAFISYRHLDNEKLEDSKGWIDNLHERLEKRLAQLLGSKPKIWRDPRIPGNVYFADLLEDRIRHNLLMVSVLSPGYVQSGWCMGELREFCRLANENGGLQVNGRLRMFKVVKTHVDREKHPAQFQGQLGYEFYETDPMTQRHREFSQDIGQNKDQRYWNKLEDLALDIREVLEATRSQASASEAQSAPAIPRSKGKVYLAECSSDLKDARDIIKRELAQRGYEILPDKEIPFKSPDYENAVRDALRGCKVSIHLIGESFGVIPEGGDERSTVRLQHEIAAQRSATRLFPGSSGSLPVLSRETDGSKSSSSNFEPIPRCKDARSCCRCRWRNSRPSFWRGSKATRSIR